MHLIVWERLHELASAIKSFHLEERSKDFFVSAQTCCNSGDENNCDTTSKTLVANDTEAEAPLVTLVSVNGDGSNGVTKIVTQKTSPK